MLPVPEAFTVCLVGLYSTSAIPHVFIRAAEDRVSLARRKRAPLLVVHLEALLPTFDLSVPLDAVVCAAPLMIFWCTAH